MKGKKVFLLALTILLIMAFTPEMAFCNEALDSENPETVTAVDDTADLDENGEDDVITENCTHDNTKVVKTKATGKEPGSKATVCKDCGAELKSTCIDSPTVKLSATKCTYDGKEHKPTVKVLTGSGKQLKSSNYTVKYAKGFKSIGKYKVTVTFKDSCSNYKGKITKTFTIRPKAPTMKPWDLNAGNGFGLQWNLLKDESKIDGYEIQWADNEDFEDANSLIMETGYIGWSSSAMGLKNGKRYYCRIRSITVKNDECIYSAWSKSKSDIYKGADQSSYTQSNKTLAGVKVDTNTGKSGNSGKNSNTTNQRSRCSACGGSGQVMRNMPTFYDAFGRMQYSLMPTRCNVCGGSGYC